MCQGIFLSALSVCKNTSEKLNIYILTASIGVHSAIPPHFAQGLQEAVCEKNADSQVTVLDISEIFGQYLPLANMTTRFTPLCMLRLFADMVPQIPEQVLYLDCDVLCRAELKELFKTDMTDTEIAGVPDRYGKWFFGNIFAHDYLNSGVLLMNMKRIRQSGLFQKCRDMCRDKKMFMPDQSALNRLARKKKINGRYNEQGKIRSDTVLKHFTTFFRFFPYIRAITIKPWQTERMHHELKIFEFDDLLKEYQRRINDAERNTHLFYH